MDQSRNLPTRSNTMRTAVLRTMIIMAVFGTTLVAGLTAVSLAIAQSGDRSTAQASAEITIRVPGNAEIFFDGQPTTETGRERSYVTPPLAIGKKYSYDILA